MGKKQKNKNFKTKSNKNKNIIKSKNEQKECCICYTIKNILILKCGHSICKKCYDKWSVIKFICPLCKKKLANRPSELPDFNEILKNIYENRNFLFSKSY